MPPKLAVCAAYPHLGLERLAIFKARAPLALDQLKFIRMSDQMRPPFAHDLCETKTDVIKSRLVHRIADAFGRIARYQYRNCIDRRLQLALRFGAPRLALAQCELGAFSILDVVTGPI